MSKNVTLQPWEATDAQRAEAERWWKSISESPLGPQTGAISWYLCANDRERRLIEYLTKIATLTKHVEELTTLSHHLKQQAIGNAQEMRTQKSIVREMYQVFTGATGEPGDWNGAEPARKVMAELAALREGATVTYRVEFQWGHSKAWEAVPAHVGDCRHATLVGAENYMNSLKPNNTLRIVEVTTRERILDTAEPNKGDQRDR